MPAQGATQGERLEKLLAHDFSTPRGRSVAEKNAYILLRKRKFKSAAAVFLLPRPAMLKEALQVRRPGKKAARSCDMSKETQALLFAGRCDGGTTVFCVEVSSRELMTFDRAHQVLDLPPAALCGDKIAKGISTEIFVLWSIPPFS